MKYLLIALLTLAFLGCATRAERAQHAADADSALQAVSMDLADMVPALKQLAGGDKVLAVVQRDAAIVTDARAYLAPAADVPHADWPQPAQTPAAIQADAGASLAKNAPPEPTTLGWLAVAGGIGVAALGILGRVAPAFPVLGPAVSGLSTMGANAVWGLLAPQGQKVADQAQAKVTDLAGQLLPLYQALEVASNSGQLPSQLSTLITPATGAAIAALARPDIHETAAGA